jgi:ADP-glucose pyrophosphorylase
MSDVEIGEDAVVSYCIIDSNVKIGKGAKIGKCKDEASGITVIGEKCNVPENAIIGDNEMISEM